MVYCGNAVVAKWNLRFFLFREALLNFSSYRYLKEENSKLYTALANSQIFFSLFIFCRKHLLKNKSFMNVSISKRDAYSNQSKMGSKNLKGNQRLPMAVIFILIGNICLQNKLATSYLVGFFILGTLHLL